MFTIEDVARVCHEINRAYCKSIGDSTQKSWEGADQWQRDSVIKGVEFALANPNATPADQHAKWMQDKVKDGWVYGDVKDAEKKTHPCIVPYAQLPMAQITKDYLFQAVVKSLQNHIIKFSVDAGNSEQSEAEEPAGSVSYVPSFAGALAALRDGHAVTREGWNGKNMFVVKQIPSTIGLDIIPKMQSLPQSAKDILLGRQQEIYYTNQLLIINAYGRADSWVPSVSDLFAEDWTIINK